MTVSMRSSSITLLFLGPLCVCILYVSDLFHNYFPDCSACVYDISTSPVYHKEMKTTYKSFLSTALDLFHMT